MPLLYYRTLCVAMLCMITCFMAQSQPNGSYGPKTISYPVPSGAYFASPTGTGNACTQSNPCSLSTALSSAPSGRTIVLRGGTYRIHSTKIPRTLTLQPYNGEKVVFKGTKIAENWQREGNMWETSWSTLFPAVYNRSKSSIVTKENPMAAHMDMVFVNGSELKQVETKGQVGSGEFFVDYNSKHIYIGSSPSGNTVEITAAQWGLHTYKVSASGITIRGIEFQHYAEAGLMMQSPNTVIENCRFLNNAISGIKAYGSTGIKIHNNLFTRNGLHGVGANGADEMIFENNTVTNNNTQKFNRNSWSAAGVKVLESKNARINNNLFKDNDANGLWLDGSSDGTFVINNEAVNNARNGIHCEISHDVVIAGNLVTGCGNNTEGLVAGGICVAESSNVRVYNNTMDNNVVNLTVSDSKRPEGQLQRETRNTVIKNNLMSDGTIAGYPSSQVWIRLKKCGDTVVKNIDNNGYHKSNVEKPNLLVRWKIGSNTCNEAEKIASLEELKDELGMGDNSVSMSGSEDPFFVSRSSGNYKIKEGSYAIKAGDEIPSDIRSALGWSGSGKVDMGAYQSGYSIASAPVTGVLPWHEDFNVVEGTYKDNGMNGGTAWTLDRNQVSGNAIFEVKDKKLIAAGTCKEGVWRSEDIAIANNTVNISAFVKSTGSLESNDYVKVYYKIDGGSEKKVAELKGNISGKTISAKNVKGKKLQVVIRIKNSDRSETYYIDDVKVTSTKSSSPSPKAPTASSKLPWKENFDNDQTYKGSLDKKGMYSYGRLSVVSSKMTARGVGQAAWKSEVVKLDNRTVSLSMILSSQGKMEANDKVRIYYKLNGGTEKLVKEVKGRINGYYKASASNIKGKTLQLVVRFTISDYQELYFLDGVEIVAKGAGKNIASKEQRKGMLVESTQHGLNCYPNPVSDQLQVSLQSDNSPQQAQVKVLDVSGRQMSVPVSMSTNEETSLNLSMLPAGVYIVQATSEDGTIQTERIIKQ